MKSLPIFVLSFFLLSLAHAQSLGLQSLSPLGGYWESPSGIQMHHNLGAVASTSIEQADVRLDQGMFIACDLACSPGKVGINAGIYQQDLIDVFPNPATERLSLQGDPIYIDHYRLFSPNGQAVAMGAIEGQAIPLHTLPAGLYLLRVFDRNGVLRYVGKVVKE